MSYEQLKLVEQRLQKFHDSIWADAGIGTLTELESILKELDQCIKEMPKPEAWRINYPASEGGAVYTCRKPDARAQEFFARLDISITPLCKCLEPLRRPEPGV